LARAHSNYDLWVLSAAFFFIFMGTGALQQLLIPYLQQTTTWGAVRASLVLATVYIGFLFWRLFAGYSIRALGDYWAVFTGAAMYTIFSLVVLLYPHLWALIVAAFAWSWGAALLWITSSAHVLDAAKREHYGRDSGIFYAATHVGFLAGLIMLQALLNRRGGQAMLLGAISATGLGTLVCLFVPRRDFPRELPRLSGVLRLAFGGAGRNIALIQFAAATAYGLLLGVFASSIKADYGIGAVAAITMSFYILRAIVSPFVGALSDRLGRARMLSGAFAISAVALIVPIAYRSAATLAFAAAVLGALTAAVLAGILAFVGDSAKSTERQATIAGMYVWRDLGTGVTILLGQYLSVLFGGFQVAFAIFAVTFAVCAWLSLRLGRFAPSGGTPST
jgi:MFS family permease